MRHLIKSGLILSLLASVVAAGCSSSSSDDSAAGGTSSGGSAGSTGEAGAPSAGTSNGGSSATEAGASNGGTSSAGSPSAGAGDDTAGAGGAADLGCNSLVIAGTPITVTHAAIAAAPTLAQGTIHPGTYQLTTETIYDGGTTTAMARSVAQISVTGTTATIDTVDDAKVKSTAVIEMGAPATMPPVSVTITCSNSALFTPFIGMDVKAGLFYGATTTTFSLYAATLHTLTVFTLKP